MLNTQGFQQARPEVLRRLSPEWALRPASLRSEGRGQHKLSVKHTASFLLVASPRPAEKRTESHLVELQARYARAKQRGTARPEQKTLHSSENSLVNV